MAIHNQPDDHVAQISFFLELLAKHVRPRGVIHVGAHQGQEVERYLESGYNNVLLVEANPEWSAYLTETFAGRPNIRVIGGAIVDFNGSVNLQIHTSRQGSTEPASVLPLKKFKEIVKTLHTPQVVRVRAYMLDTLFERFELDLADYNFLNIDVQGAEHLAFQGGAHVLAAMDAVLTEVNLVELYADGARKEDIDRLLTGYEFARLDSVYHELYDEKSRFPAWGETLFVKKQLLARSAA